MTRIYPSIMAQFVENSNDGKDVKFDYIAVSDAGEYDKLLINIEGKEEHKDSFVCMELTIDEAEVLIAALQSKVWRCKNDVEKLDYNFFKK